MCGLLKGNHVLYSLSFWTINGGQFFPLSIQWWQQGGRQKGRCSFKELSLPPPQRWELWRRTTGKNTALAPPWSKTWFAGTTSLFPSAHPGSGWAKSWLINYEISCPRCWQLPSPHSLSTFLSPVAPGTWLESVLEILSKLPHASALWHLFCGCLGQAGPRSP